MSFCNRGRFRQQVRFLRRQFLQDGKLPFTDVLSDGTITQALKALEIVWLDRVYSPLITLWVFLGQVLSQDHSCRAAALRALQGAPTGRARTLAPRASFRLPTRQGSTRGRRRDSCPKVSLNSPTARRPVFETQGVNGYPALPTGTVGIVIVLACAGAASSAKSAAEAARARSLSKADKFMNVLLELWAMKK